MGLVDGLSVCTKRSIGAKCVWIKKKTVDLRFKWLNRREEVVGEIEKIKRKRNGYEQNRDK